MNHSQKYSDLLRTSLPRLKEKYPITRLGLFGSVMRDDFDPVHSDIDVMVELSKPDYFAFVSLADELELLFNKKVDLVSLHGVKPRYFEYIKEDLEYVQ